MMAFTGNSPAAGHGGNQAKDDIFKAFKTQKPDLLFFSGDQVYDHRNHLAMWIKFGREYGEMVRDIPTITIPDDHDVGQANLWGAGGKPTPAGASGIDAQDGGGYKMSTAFVNMVQRTQANHLPDPYDPTPFVLRSRIHHR